MKRQINHKDLTLLFGIFVAMVIAFTLWIRTPEPREASKPTDAPSAPAKPTAGAIINLSHKIVRTLEAFDL